MAGNNPPGPARWDGTWEGLPPKRRRFFIWLFLCWFILGTVGRGLLENLGMPATAAGLLTLAAAGAVLVPTGRAALKEYQQRRAKGEEPEPEPVTGRKVALWVVLALLLWAAMAALLLWDPQPLVPILPLIVTVMTVIYFRRWRREQAVAGPAGPEKSGGARGEAGAR